DSENQKGTDQLILLVVPENSAPIVDAGVDQIADERTMVNLVCSAYDPDGDMVTSSWTSSNSDVVIDNPSSLSTSVKLPAVTKDQTIT
ncbi:MAG: peptidase, partial [Nitrosopumilales archaeon CG_4_9_14_0_8_um_filter_34_10]